jgi:hypothetical protein
LGDLIPKWFVLTLGLASAANAQSTISGRVVDPAGKPAPNVEVLLHAVAASAGAQVDRDTSRADGSFTLTAQSPDPKAVYFVAVMQGGELFMGELIRPPFPTTKDYVVQVGVNPVDMTRAATTNPTAPAVDNQAGLVVLLFATAMFAAIAWWALRRRPPLQRRWLVELARLDDKLAEGIGDRARLERRRAELRARLCR